MDEHDAGMPDARANSAQWMVMGRERQPRTKPPMSEPHTKETEYRNSGIMGSRNKKKIAKKFAYMRFLLYLCARNEDSIYDIRVQAEFCGEQCVGKGTVRAGACASESG